MARSLHSIASVNWPAAASLREHLVSLDRGREAVDFGLELGDLRGRTLAGRFRRRGVTRLRASGDGAAAGSLVEDPPQLLDLGMNLRLAARADRWRLVRIARDSWSRPAINRNRANASSV